MCPLGLGIHVCTKALLKHHVQSQACLILADAGFESSHNESAPPICGLEEPTGVGKDPPKGVSNGCSNSATQT